MIVKNMWYRRLILCDSDIPDSYIICNFLTYSILLTWLFYNIILSPWYPSIAVLQISKQNLLCMHLGSIINWIELNCLRSEVESETNKYLRDFLNFAALEPIAGCARASVGMSSWRSFLPRQKNMRYSVGCAFNPQANKVWAILEQKFIVICSVLYSV